MEQSMFARVALESGRVFAGRSFGAPGLVEAEVVFNTSHQGYLEVITDPSYRRQALCFTMPLLGIYGVSGDEDLQSAGPQVGGVICREASRRASSWRSRATLGAWLAEHGVVGIDEVDTRSLVQHLRDEGSQRGVLATGRELSDEELVARARGSESMAGLDLAKVVTTEASYVWGEGFAAGLEPWGSGREGPVGVEGGAKVVVVDFGVKRDILRHLASRGLEVEVVPAATSLEAVLEREPAGVLLSNGPGDPAAVGYGVELAKGLVRREGLPVFGVCLGYQILCLAMGATTYKMKFGHRGGNHPVRDEATGRVEITAQNHGFAVGLESLRGTALKPTHVSLFDQTLEGVAHVELPIQAVQFHPEAGPGPHESSPFFDRFAEAVGGVVSAAGRG